MLTSSSRATSDAKNDSKHCKPDQRKNPEWEAVVVVVQSLVVEVNRIAVSSKISCVIGTGQGNITKKKKFKKKKNNKNKNF